jgi:hypothetical protein
MSLNLIFENATAGRNTDCRSVVNRASCSLQFQLTVSVCVTVCVETALGISTVF